MKLKWKIIILIFCSIILSVIIVFLSYILSTTTCAFGSGATPTSSELEFQITPNGDRYTGCLVSSNYLPRTNKIKITLYDEHSRIIETGLLSEYSINNVSWHYLDYKDVNNNDRLDAVDIIIVQNKGDVNENWFVVLTYESSGTTIASSLLSNKEFSIKEEEQDYDPRYYILFYEINIFILVLVLVYIYTRKN
jgi:hypothetical protein